MSGLFSTLQASVSALNAQSVAIDVTGKNLANVNNTSYSRETVQFGSLGTVETPQGPESSGVTALGVQQVRSAILDTQVQQEASLTSYYNTEQSAYQQAQAALGQTVSSTDSAGGQSTNGLGAAINGLFNAFQSYAADPTDTGQQQGVLAAASVLTDQMQSTDQNLAEVQSGLTSQASSDVTTANGLLTSIASLNEQIGRFESNAPGSAVDLRDEREADLEQLSGLMPVTSTEGTNGEDTITAAGASGSPVTLVSGANVTGPLTLSGTTISGGSSASALTLASGSIQGSLDASTNGIQTLRDNLNQIASELVTSVNAVYNPTGATGNFFDSSGTTAGTLSVDPSLTAATLTAGVAGQSGDNSIAVAMANLANQQFSTSGGDQIDGTFSGFYANSVSGFGQTLASVNDQVTTQTNIQTLVNNQRQAVSGVSLDEEMSNLLMYQRSYQASSEVFQTVDSMLDDFLTSISSITT
jgi:flagellar hook-associated protein 1